MAGEFKPGDRVRVTGGVGIGTVTETGDGWWMVQWNSGVLCRHIGSGLEPAPASSPGTPEGITQNTLARNGLRAISASEEITLDGAAGERNGLRSDLCRAIADADCDGVYPQDPRDYVHRRGQEDATAWNERIEARADAILPIIDRHTAKALETALRERDEARAALASEQTAHAETRKALEDEREACAKVADRQADMGRRNYDGSWQGAAEAVAADIRARASLSPTQEKADG